MLAGPPPQCSRARVGRCADAQGGCSEGSGVSSALSRLREALALVERGRHREALAIVEEVLATCDPPTTWRLREGRPLPDGILPWLRLARTALAESGAPVPPFLALQTAIVLLEV
jgi:hypothetical protein